jgi:hypothetical protein
MPFFFALYQVIYAQQIAGELTQAFDKYCQSNAQAAS